MSAQPLNHPGGHRRTDAHACVAAGVQDTARAKQTTSPRFYSPGRALSLADQGTPGDHSSAVGEGTSNHPGQSKVDAQFDLAGVVKLPPAQTLRATMPNPESSGLVGTDRPAETIEEAMPDVAASRLADPSLYLAAEVVDDLERVRIANENRLRILTRDVEDSDGETRGFGLTEDHPDVARLAGIIDAMRQLEHDAVVGLQKRMRAHPLGPWVKAQRNIGDKQAARLIAAIGDPYWNTLHNRPRTVSELWAFCGLHTVPADQSKTDIQGAFVGGGQTGSDPGQISAETHNSIAWVAARRRKGQRANWSNTAKMRAYVIAESCMKGLVKPCARLGDDVHATHVEDCTCSPYRLVYDARRAVTVGRVHAQPCPRCGPSGKPAQPGSPWSLKHAQADALRIVSKQILRDLWREARDIHCQDNQIGGTP